MSRKNPLYPNDYIVRKLDPNIMKELCFATHYQLCKLKDTKGMNVLPAMTQLFAIGASESHCRRWSTVGYRVSDTAICSPVPKIGFSGFRSL